MTRTLTSTLVAAILLGWAVACAPRHAFDNPERPPPTPDPEVPATFGVADLHDEMWRLARDVERINVIMRRNDAPLTEAEQAEILALLESLEAHAQRLAERDARTVHPVLGENIELFRSDLAIAKRNAAATPPNFYMAGTIAGTCAYCHGLEFGKVHSGGSP